LEEGFQVQTADPTRVKDMMTPIVFSVAPAAPAFRVVTDMHELKVNRLFVVDRAGVLVGVISALDVLRHLRPEDPVAVSSPEGVPCSHSEPLGFEPW
jgi:CBS-domain-containing membrane protein